MARFTIITFFFCTLTGLLSYGRSQQPGIGPIETLGVFGSARGVTYTIPFTYRSKLGMPPFTDDTQLEKLRLDVQTKENSFSASTLQQIRRTADAKVLPILKALQQEAPKQLKAKYKEFYPFTYTEYLQSPRNTNQEIYMGKEKFLKELKDAKEFVTLWVYAQHLKERTFDA